MARRAFLIGTSVYSDDTYAALPSCITDVWQLKQVLEHPAIGGFDDVQVALNAAAEHLRYEIVDFFSQATPGDLALLYITGHGLRLTRSTGEFFFVTADTAHQRIEESAIGAAYVNEQLELCRAAQKVAILDCCQSGGFVHGFATRDTKSAEAAIPLVSRGVYVLSSSGASQASFAGEGANPSVFTEEIVNGLLTGRADHDGDGIVSVDDLFHHVSSQLRQRSLAAPQTPVKSAHGVTGRIDLARSAVGRSLELQPPRASDREVPKSEPVRRGGSWPALISYYRSCLVTESKTMRPLTRDDVVNMHGQERLLCGDSRAELPPETKELLAQQPDSELWYGYPTVVMFRDKNGRALATPTIAPLVVRQVDIVDQELVAFGPAMPNPQLAAGLLSEEEAENLMATYRPTWHSGRYAEMVRDLRHLLRELEVDCVEELRPELLASDIDQVTPTSGARNAAVLFALKPNESTIRQLLNDLDELHRRAVEIPKTALAGLFDPPVTAPSTDWQLVAPLPLNESQQNVVASAMRERVTIATGPPGTGKSQLVVAAVATAVCAGQRVLVASNNNQAVQEVWERCERLAPSALIRSGNRKMREEEGKGLSQLLSIPQPSTTRATTVAKLAAALDDLQRVRGELAAVAALERDLLQAGQLREAALSELGSTPDAVRGSWESWERRATKVARARLFGGWRRAWLFRRARLSVPADKAACAAFARYAAAQASWHRLIKQLDTRDDAESLLARHEAAWEQVTQASQERLQCEIARGSREGRQQIVELIQASAQGGGDWRELLRALRHVRGWAVTNQSARRLPLNPALFDLVIIDEASQCSIAGILPLLFRAHRALIIGDPMQLAHVSTLDPAQEARNVLLAGLHPAWLEERRLAYHRHSAFHAASTAVGRTMLLDEHYRCHPDIAEVSNRLFYNGQLTVLVDVHRQRNLGRPAITWIDLRGKAQRGRTGSWLNQEEARKAIEVAKGVTQRRADISVGIVTPFSAQSELLKHHLSGDDRVRAGTAHTFQGGERDIIVLSLVASDSMSKNAVMWLNRQLNLWNVAITRARAHLVVLGDRSFWSRQGGVAAELLASSDGAADVSPDPMALKLYGHLTEHACPDVELNVRLDGYLADAVCRDGTLAVLLDRGAPDDDLAKHLRVQCIRTRLLASPSANRESVRLAAWRLYGSDAEGRNPGTTA
ncbi:AAA domain-containing protein [Nonomuraea sp. NPDC059194]|uniref:caspase, EACC1-associated type n=1 Tax=Nonomuraea sp. NPDC059194 TaxID=3346764 RepID=UPI0036973023